MIEVAMKNRKAFALVTTFFVIAFSQMEHVSGSSNAARSSEISRLENGTLLPFDQLFL